MSLTGKLDELLLRWGRSGCDQESLLAPGRPAIETRRILTDAGFDPSDEILEWYGWRDGPLRKAWVSMGPSNDPLLSVRDAIELGRLHAAIDEEYAVEGGALWKPCFLPIVQGGSQSFVYAKLAGGSTSQVGENDSSGRPEDEVCLASIESLVDLWLEVFDRGAARWDDGVWEINYDLLTDLPATNSFL